MAVGEGKEIYVLCGMCLVMLENEKQDKAALKVRFLLLITAVTVHAKRASSQSCGCGGYLLFDRPSSRSLRNRVVV